MIRLITLPARCLLELLRGMAEGPGYIDPSDPLKRRPDPRPGNPDTDWRAGALPMGKTPVAWWKQKPPARGATGEQIDG
jgi:hypothetical protein